MSRDPPSSLRTNHHMSFKNCKLQEFQSCGSDAINPEYINAQSVGNSSVFMDVQAERKVARSECCFITKAPCYMNQQVHWVNAVPERKANIVCIRMIHCCHSLSHRQFGTGIFPLETRHRSNGFPPGPHLQPQNYTFFYPAAYAKYPPLKWIPCFMVRWSNSPCLR